MLINQRGNILIFSPRSSYMLRLIALGPDRYTGVEARVTGLRETRGIIEGTPPCGFRLCQGGKWRHCSANCR